MSPRYQPKKKARSVAQATPSLPVLQPHAADMDIGARAISVAVPPTSDPKPVHGIADLTGVTGLAILEAILAGQRDPVVLAQLKHPRIRASTDTLAKSLRGDWRPEHLFTLRQTLATWNHYQAQVTACDEETARLLQAFAAKVDVAVQPLPPRTSTHKTPQKNEPRFAAREELYRTCGVDLTQVPGIQSGTALVLVAELGPDFAARFPTAKHFGSWLGLCPDNRIPGGKIMSSATREVKRRAATTLRLAAQGLNFRAELFWRPLPALEGAPWDAQGHQRDGAHTGAHPLASLQASGSVQPGSLP